MHRVPYFMASGPLHCFIYTAVLNLILSSLGVAAHQYAAFTQANVHGPAVEATDWVQKMLQTSETLNWCLDVVEPPSAESCENPVHLGLLVVGSSPKLIFLAFSNASLVSLPPLRCVVYGCDLGPETDLSKHVKNVGYMYVEHAFITCMRFAQYVDTRLRLKLQQL